MNVATAAPHGGDGWELPGYDLLQELGRSEMATTVYRARQCSLDRSVVIWVQLGGAETFPFAQRLKRTAAILARLQHPYVLSVLDCFEHEGRTCLVLEHVEGGTLAEKIAGRQQPVCPAATLVERLARTISFVHQRGIVHCDLKPHHVLLAAPPAPDTPGRVETRDCEDAYGIPRLSGFDFAVDRRQADSFKEGVVVGTPAYMAPELARGPSPDLGPATDIYGLGTILYELLTGRPPNQAETAFEAIKQALEREPESVRQLNPGVDRKLEAICLKCLRKDPARRYADGRELAAELRDCVSGLGRKRWF